MLAMGEIKIQLPISKSVTRSRASITDRFNADGNLLTREAEMAVPRDIAELIEGANDLVDDRFELEIGHQHGRCPIRGASRPSTDIHPGEGSLARQATALRVVSRAGWTSAILEHYARPQIG